MCVCIFNAHTGCEQITHVDVVSGAQGVELLHLHANALHFQEMHAKNSQDCTPTPELLRDKIDAARQSMHEKHAENFEVTRQSFRSEHDARQNFSA